MVMKIDKNYFNNPYGISRDRKLKEIWSSDKMRFMNECKKSIRFIKKFWMIIKRMKLKWKKFNKIKFEDLGMMLRILFKKKILKNKWWKKLKD